MAVAIRKASGVLAVKVDFPTELATVGTAAGQPVPREEIQEALKTAGFSAEITGPKR